MTVTHRRWCCLLPLVGLLAACGSQPPRPAAEPLPPLAVKPAPVPPRPAATPGGGYYQDDGPGANPPPDISAIPDARPRLEPLNRLANRPYSVFGRDYVPMTHLAPYRASGMASWYGRKFNGQKTSTGETYDMYAMTAAHPTLPIPSYVRVTNPANGKSVVVRVNDRGPFLDGRLIDLSYTAAAKLGIVGAGSARVDVESIIPGEQRLAAAPDPIAQIAMASSSEADDPGPAALPELHEARGVYLQLGAFGNPNNAENLKASLASKLADLSDKLLIQSSGGIYRVNLGPWRNHAEAQRVALRLRAMFELNPLVVRQ